MVWADGLWFLGGQLFASDAFFSLWKVINTCVLVKLLQFSVIVKITTHNLFKSVMFFYTQWWLCCFVLQQIALFAWACQSNPNKTKRSYNCMKVILYGSTIYGHVAVNCDPGRKIASLLLVWPNLEHWEDLIPFSYILGICGWFWFHTVLDALDSNFCWDLSSETKIDYIRKDLIFTHIPFHICLWMHMLACVGLNIFSSLILSIWN
jgi:hypothetical protein